MNLKDYQKGRNDGLMLAKRIVDEGGAEALAEEMRIRGVTGISMNLTLREVEEALNPIKDMTIRTLLAMSVATLRDEYGFGKERLQRYIDRFMDKTDCLAAGWVTWKDLCETIEKETGIEISFVGMYDTSSEENGSRKAGGKC